MEEQHAEVLDLRDYLAVLRRRRWTVIQTVVLVLVVAMAVTLTRTPMYASTVRLIVEPNTGGDDDTVLRQMLLGERELETQRELVTSRAVADKVVEDLASDIDVDDLRERTSVTIIRDTQIMEIQATSSDPAEAAEIAQTMGEAYLEYREEQALGQLLRSSDALQEREVGIRERLDEIERELRTSGATSGLDAAELSSEVQGLIVERDRLQTELAGLAAQQANLGGTAVFARGGGQIVAPAEIPEAPFSPKPLRTGVLALVLGLMLGVGLAFLRDFMDDAIRSEEQAKRATGRPVIGHVPQWRGATDGESRLVSLVEPSSPEAESYRTLRTNLRFLASAQSAKSVLFTSAIAGDGKTTTAGNLAVALARSNLRVLLVGADLRKPAIHRSFGVEMSPGLSDLLIGEAEVASTVVDVGVPNLRVIPSGRIPPNPAELLGSPAMLELMRTLEQIADIVIYDGPPTLAVADALELAPRVGLSVMVVDAGNTGRHALAQAASRLSAVGAELGGVVLNRAGGQDGYYGYSYYASYTEDDKAPKGRRFGRRSRWASRAEPSPAVSSVFTARRPPVGVVQEGSVEEMWDDGAAMPRAEPTGEAPTPRVPSAAPSPPPEQPARESWHADDTSEREARTEEPREPEPAVEDAPPQAAQADGYEDDQLWDGQDYEADRDDASSTYLR